MRERDETARELQRVHLECARLRARVAELERTLDAVRRILLPHPARPPRKVIGRDPAGEPIYAADE